MYVYPLGNPRTSQWKEIVKMGLSLSRQTQTLYVLFFRRMFDLIVYSGNGNSSVTDVSFINQSIAFLLRCSILGSVYTT